MEQLPILIYKGDSICYNVLNEFAEQFGNALSKMGETVEYYDLEKGDISGLAAYVGRRFKAIIGFQTFVFDIYLEGQQRYLHDLILGPKFNFQFDHPVWMYKHYRQMPTNCYILTHDRDYQSFVRHYYPEIVDCLILPPGGTECKYLLKKEYDVVFLGSYSNYRDYWRAYQQAATDLKEIAEVYWDEMVQMPELNAETALRHVILKLGIGGVSDNQFLNLMYDLKHVIYGVMSYYREKVVDKLLTAGFSLEVYGESWRSSPFVGNESLHIHSAVAASDGLEELAKSRVSLNVMAWHKDGFTERIANSMMNHSVVVSDQSRYLREQFKDKKELFLYDLSNLEVLPDVVQQAIVHNQSVAEAAYEKAKKSYSWEKRAEAFLEL